jgi:hypothetical protein
MGNLEIKEEVKIVDNFLRTVVTIQYESLIAERIHVMFSSIL